MVLAGTSMDIRPGSRRSSSNGSSKQEERGKGGRGKRRKKRLDGLHVSCVRRDAQQWQHRILPDAWQTTLNLAELFVDRLFLQFPAGDQPGRNQQTRTAGKFEVCCVLVFIPEARM